MNLYTELSITKKFLSENRQTLSVIITVFIVLYGVQYLAIGGVFGKLLYSAYGLLYNSEQLTRLIAWSFGCVFFYLIIPVTVVLVRKEKLSSYGWDLRSLKRHFPYYAVLCVPIAVTVFFASSQRAFQHMYPFYKNPESLQSLLLWEVFYGLQFVALEFFFRGFILHGLKNKFGWYISVVIMSLPYMMIHFPKPALESLGAVVFGIVLAIASLRTKSIFGGIFLHLTVAYTMDFSALYHAGWFLKH